MNTLLFTGASGFLGNNVLKLLNTSYMVDTLGFGNEMTYNCNIVTDNIHFEKKYDVVLHAAGKAHINPRTEEEKKLFYDINLEGTKNLCRALEESFIPKSFIFISTVAVYGCEYGELIDETYPLNGNTPYADSKKKAEKYLQDWCSKHSVILTILRPSLLAGVNPPGNLGAMIQGIKTGRYFSIAGGIAKKSVAMASDIAQLVPICENKGGIYNLCDTHNPSFHELEVTISRQLGKKEPIIIPYFLAKMMAIVGNLLGSKAPINTLKLKKITESLTFSNRKLIEELGFMPSDVLTNFKIK